MRRWANPIDFFARSSPLHKRRRNPVVEYRVIGVDPATGAELLAVYFLASSAIEAENKAAMDFGNRGLMFAGYKGQKPTGPSSVDLYLYFRPMPVVAPPVVVSPVVVPPVVEKPAGPPSPVEYLAPTPAAKRGRPPTPAGRVCAVCGKSGGSPAGEALAALGLAERSTYAHPACLKKAQARKAPAPVAVAGPPSPVEYLAPKPPVERAATVSAAPTEEVATPVSPSAPEPPPEPQPEPETPGAFTWMPQQKAIFADVATGRGHTQVIARAGCGKSTTIMGAFEYLPPGKNATVVAFGAAIAADLKRKIQEKGITGVTVSTLNSVGNQAVRTAYRGIFFQDGKDVRVSKTRDIVIAEVTQGESSVGRQPSRDLINAVEKLVDLAKATLSTTHQEYAELMDRFDISTAGVSEDKFFGYADRVLSICKRDTRRFDFSDQIWFPVVHNLRVPQYDFVFIDEAQDLNKAQIELCLKMCKPGGRIISVGDPAQSIYQFRGADINAIPNIVKRLGAKKLGLTVTRRCAKKIVALAQKFVPDFTAFPANPEGSVETISATQMMALVRPGDFILSRLRAPMIGICLALLRARIPANIKGRDLGKDLANKIKESKAKTVEELLAWNEEVTQMEVQRAVARDKDPEPILDKGACIPALCEGARTLEDVQANIEKLFYEGDETKRVIISTIHGAKGLERDRVFVLENTLRPGKSEEEDNLVYVAITRAKNELYLVQGSK